VEAYVQARYGAAGEGAGAQRTSRREIAIKAAS